MSADQTRKRAMPRQNRVTPFGDIIATPERGTFMGNRGILHDAEGHIRRAWQLRRWIVCVLEFRGRKRQVMAPDHYTELFFLDEATALAAGHRPCAECRRERFNAFRKAWKLARPGTGRSSTPNADEIDRRLHAERIGPYRSKRLSNRSKRLSRAQLNELPSGVFVQHADWGGGAYLVWNEGLLAWSGGGYAGCRERPKRKLVTVLTPESTVATIRAGYVPEVHPSAAALA
jgi:hypothetical protein